ncbi:hypothetical protein [Streptomyces sp. NPDC059166]|uniref:hypothetical protein n=1 Tax=Streptomyces sp. NPDC059166 TaxID=3346752 RepID=UPI0036CCF23F
MGYSRGGQGRAEKVARGCTTAVLVVVCVVCVVALGALWQIHRALDRTPPDVGAFAHSTAVRTAGTRAAQRSSARLGELTSALPWAAPLGTSVADSCRTENQNAFIGPANWAPVNCARSTVLYLAFDGDIRTRLRQVDAVLTERGWAGPDSSPRTLTETATWLSQAGGAPSPTAAQRGSTEPPGSRPICLSTVFGPAAQKQVVTHGGLGIRLRVAVAELPCTPRAETGDIQIDGAPEKFTADGAVYLDWHPLSTDAVTRSAYTTRRYVAAISLVDNYAVQTTPSASGMTSPRHGGAGVGQRLTSLGPLPSAVPERPLPNSAASPVGLRSTSPDTTLASGHRADSTDPEGAKVG